MASPNWDQWSCTSTNNLIIVHQPSTDSRLKIKFHRTIRVPDNNETAQLPPSHGLFPLSKIQDYSSELPKAIAAKGGIFFPMYQKEAMWMSFEATSPFMIKVYAGGVNAISGEHHVEDLATKFRRLKLNYQNKSIQDYVVAPSQNWLDGFATSPGVVKQFVAMPLGAGYTVEGQLTGQEALGGLQIEITPVDTATLRLPTERTRFCVSEFGNYQMPHVSEGFHILVKTLTGKIFDIPCRPDTMIDQIKCAVWKMSGQIMDEQRLIWAGKQLEDGRDLASYNITNESTLHLVIRMRGGGMGPEGMGLAAGGKIKQAIHEDNVEPSLWNSHATLAIRVHVFNSQDFHRVTGKAPPPSPVTAADYAAAGLPFFEMYEENSKISGDFGKLKSVNEIDQENGLAEGPEATVNPSIIKLGNHDHTFQSKTQNVGTLNDAANAVVASNTGGEAKTPAESQCTASFHNPHGIINPAGPLRDFRCLRDLESELSDLSLDDLEV